MRETRTVTVLFTDMVDSTALLSRLGPGAAEEVRRRHFALLRDALGVTGGTEVKNLGDGLMAVFDSAASAVSCAVAMQQAVERHNRRAAEPVMLKIGAALGDADVEDADYFGVPVVEAARLCALAAAGEILTTDVVRVVAQGRVPESFRSLGTRELKGLTTPVLVHSVQWELADAGPARPLPAVLDRAAREVFVGRDRERDVLAGAWKLVADGDRRLVLVAGEPGIGKTRLVAEFASEIAPAGATVLYGRCDPELGMPYVPWAEALRSYVQSAPFDVLAAHVGRHGGEILRLVPEVTSRIRDVPPPRSGDTDSERYWLLDAAVGLLAGAASDAPVLLVLDDLQWADRSSLQLLERLLDTVEPSPLLVVGAYRDTELPGSALESCLPTLHRTGGVDLLRLDGLSEPNVAELAGRLGVASTCAGAFDGLVHELWRETDGNPFFTTELLRHIVEAGIMEGGADPAALTLPASIREVIGERVRRLGDAAQPVLAAAAVVGRPFDADLLTRAVDVAPDTVLDVLDSAAAAAVLTESGTEPGEYAFTHALIGHSIYGALSAPRKRRLHSRVAAALEAGEVTTDGDRAAELAHHWARAADVESLTRAAGYATAAGDAARERLAPDQAVAWYSRAIGLQDRTDGAEAHERCALLIRLGVAQRDAGDPEHRRTLLDAADLAAALRDGDLLAAAALENSRGFFSFLGETDLDRVRVLEAAVSAAPDDVAEARLLALLAAELLFGAPLARRRELSDRALSLARHNGDPATLAFVLNQRFNAIHDPSTLDERRAEIDEALLLTDQIGDPTARFLTLSLAGHAAMEAGDRERWDDVLGEAGKLAGRLGQPTITWVHSWWRATDALVAGHAGRAEELALQACDAGTKAGHSDAEIFFGAQILSVRLMQGRFAEYQALVSSALVEHPGFPWLRACLAEAELSLGRPEEAAALLAREVQSGFGSVREDPNRLLTLVMYAELAAGLRDAEACSVLYPLLLPGQGQMAGQSVVCLGAVDRYLGQLAEVLGRLTEAEVLLRGAVLLEDGMGAVYCAGRSRLALAAFLQSRGGDDDSDEAGRLRAEVARTAAAIDAADLDRRLGGTALGPAHDPAGTL